MKKIRRVPKNWVENVKCERYVSPDHYSVPMYSYSYNEPDKRIPTRCRINLKIVLDIDENSREDLDFIRGLEKHGLQWVVDNGGGISLDKFRFVMNEGFQRLPMLIRHNDPEVAEIAWLISKYFSKREEIMPEEIV